MKRLAWSTWFALLEIAACALAAGCGHDRGIAPDARVIDPDAKPIFCATPKGQPCPTRDAAPANQIPPRDAN